MKTIFLDIDGTIVEHLGSLHKQLKGKPALLPSTLEVMSEWVRKDYKIILTTGRREGNRSETEEMLRSYGIPYDQLIMGLPRGERIVINDSKPDGTITVKAISLIRNQGLSGANVDANS